MALIGCGGMGKNLAKGGQASELGNLVVACDMDEERATAAAEELDAEACTDMMQVFDRDDVDVILVATPNFAHKDCVVAAAKTGKPIFCEKPMALTVAQCDEMISACEASGSSLMIGQVLRYIGGCATAIDLVNEGRIGEPFSIHVARMGYPDLNVQAPWRHKIALSGGTLFEFGVHEIDFMGCICGDAASVYATGDNFIHKGGYDYPDHIYLNIKYKNGMTGFYANGAASVIRWNENRIWGAEGCLAFGSWGGGVKVQRAGEDEELVEVKRDPHVQHEVTLFLTAARDATPMEIPGEVGRANVAIAEAGLKSIETGEIIQL